MKRSIIGAAALTIIVLLAGITSAQEQASSDGAMYRANSQRTGVLSTKGVPALNGRLWESAKLFTMKREKVITEMGRDLNLLGVGMVYFPGGSWHFKTDFGYSDPVVSGGAIYFTVFMGDGYLLALDAATGGVKWRAKRPGGSFTYPCVAGDTLYVGSGGPDGSFFYAMDLKTQEEKWRFKFPDKTGGTTPASVADGALYFATGDGTFYALDAQTGRKKWAVEASREGRLAIPAIADGTVYFGDKDGQLRALDAGTGREKWKLKARAGISSLAVSGGALYVRDFEGQIFVVDAKAGRLPPDPLKGVKASTPLAIDNQTIYYGGWKGENIYAADAATGKQRWKFDTTRPCQSPVIAEGVLYFSCMDGKLYALDAATGKPKWALATEQPELSNPAIADGVLYYISDDGRVHALK